MLLSNLHTNVQKVKLTCRILTTLLTRLQKPYATLSHNYFKIISDYCIALTMILLFFSIISFGIMVMLILTDTQRRH